jgi:hypothetical protein
MKIDIANFNEIIKVNNLVEIKDSTYISNNQPSPEGLFSYEIFGKPGTQKRRFQWAYIDLKKKFLHPLVYDAIYKSDRKLPSLLKGEIYAVLDSETGELKYVPDETLNSFTGLNGYYENFKKIKFKKGTKGRNANLEFISSLTIDQIFIDKFLVCPPFYRDIDFTPGETLTSDEMSDLYKKLISYCKSFDKESMTSLFVSYSAEYNVQMTLLELYKYVFKNSKKSGYINESLLGKNVDYSIRGVLSSPKMSSLNYDTQLVRFGEVGVPLHMLLIAFLPFVIYELTENVFARFRGGSLVVENIENNKIHKIDEFQLEQFSSKNFEKLINIYTKSHEDRLSNIKVIDVNGKEISAKVVDVLNQGNIKNNFVSNTLTELLYYACTKAIENKFVYLTRYPIEDYLNVIPLKPVILTVNTVLNLHLKEVDTYYRNYPVIADKDNVQWIDSIQPHLAYLPQLGADFDGDTVSIRGIFSQEANLEADNLRFKTINLLNGEGTTSKNFSKEGTISLYKLTEG